MLLLEAFVAQSVTKAFYVRFPPVSKQRAGTVWGHPLL